MQGKAGEMFCPRCGNSFIQRIPREGHLDRVLSFIFIYPFRCQVCRNRFRMMRWGVRYNRVPEDRRQYRRRPVRFPVTLRSHYGEHTGQATDLSIGGCSIDIFAPYREGDVLSVRLATSDHAPPIEVDTAVVRTVSHGRLGLEFLTVHDHEEARLRQLMRSLWIEGTPAQSECQQ